MRSATLRVSFALFCLLVAACGDWEDWTSAHETIAESGAGAASGDEPCDADIVKTILPGQHGTKVVALCKSCDDGCDDKGSPCATYGDSCDYFGTQGVCAACCDGETGALRCHPID